MISVNFALSWFATWLEQRLRKSKRGPAPMEAEPLDLIGDPSRAV
jgi:glutamate transport system permease protein